MNEKERPLTFNFYDFIILILKYKRYFIITFIAVAIIASLVAMLLPKHYSATAVILPPSGGGGGVPSFLSKDLVGIASTFGLETTSNEMYQTILQSRTLMERVIDNNDLRTAYKIPADARAEDVLRSFASRYEVKTRADFSIEISYVDKVPERTAQVANSVVRELDKRFNEIMVESARKNRIFIERRLKAANDSLASLQDSLRRFQKITGVISLSDQVSALIKSASELKAEQLSTELQMLVLKENFGDKNPMVEQLALTSKILGEQYDLILAGTESELVLALGNIPDISKEYLDLLRLMRIQTSLIEFIYPQYESASIQEQKESVNIQVLDYARVPEKRFKPKRKLIVMVSVLSVMLLTLLYVVFLEYWNRLPSQNQDDWEKVNHIKRMFRK